jgi:hypothetical protein
MKPSSSLRYIRSSLNFLLVPAGLFTFFAFWMSMFHPQWYAANVSIYGLGLYAVLLFAVGYVCRLVVLWQMRQAIAPKRKSSSRRRSAKPRKLPYSLGVSDWVIELTALLWAGAIFLYLAFTFFRTVIPIGFNTFN